MKKTKRTKSFKKKSLLSRLLLPIIIAVVAFFSISYYYVANYGTGPLSFLVGTPMVALLVEDTGNGIKITQTSTQAAHNTGAKVTDTNTGKSVTITNKSKDGAKLDSAIVAVVGKGSSNKLKTITDNAVINASTCTDDKGTGCVTVKTSDIKAATQAQAKTDCLARGATWSDSMGCLSPNAPITTPVNNTCSTNGTPISVGSWVSTGVGLNDDGSSCDGTACPQRQCVKCTGGPKEYEGSMTCKEAMTQGLPVVLPQSAGKEYTGLDKSVSTCFTKKNDTWIQIAIGQENDNNVCTPDGQMTEKAKVAEQMTPYCNSLKSGQEFRDGKCQDPGNTAPSVPPVNTSSVKSTLAQCTAKKTPSQVCKVAIGGGYFLADVQASVVPEKDQTVQARLDVMLARIKATGKCQETNVDLGIRITCDPITHEPVFSFCDGGKGKFDNSGNCTLSSNFQAQSNAPKTGDLRCSGNYQQVYMPWGWVANSVCSSGCGEKSCNLPTLPPPKPPEISDSVKVGELRCSGNNQQVYMPWGWVVNAVCPNGCTDDRCAQPDINLSTPPKSSGDQPIPGDLRCSGDGKYNQVYMPWGWVASSNCPNGCGDNGQCKPTPFVSYTEKIVVDIKSGTVHSPDLCSSGKYLTLNTGSRTAPDYVCRSKSGEYANPETGLGLDGTWCSNGSQCDSGYCEKRGALGVDVFALDQCAPSPVGVE